jgi:hypothetical protein
MGVGTTSEKAKCRETGCEMTCREQEKRSRKTAETPDWLSYLPLTRASQDTVNKVYSLDTSSMLRVKTGSGETND